MDFQLILKSPEGVSYDVTERMSLEDSGTLSLSVERNLHEFRAGDFSVILEDGDGEMAALFEDAEPSDRWDLKFFRDDEPLFLGVVIPVDMVSIDRRNFTVEINAVDLSKALEDVTAETVRRPSTSYALTATATAGTNLLTLNTTAGLMNGDELNLFQGLTSEDVVIALVKSSTQVQLTDNTLYTFTSAATVTLSTPYYRARTPAFLIDALLDAAGDRIAGRSVQLTGPTGRVPVFADQSTNLLDQILVPTSLLQKGGKQFAGFAATSFDQASPETDWGSVAPARNWVDWTPYRTQAQGEPATFANSPSGDPDQYGVDFTPGALVAYFLDTNGAALCRLNKYTSADGVTWAGPTIIATVFSAGAGNTVVGFSGDYDSTRNRFYYVARGSAGTQEFGYYDLSGATDNTISTASTYSLAGTIRYSAEADLLMLRNAKDNHFEAWRDVTKQHDSPVFTSLVLMDAKQLRFLAGRWIWLGTSRGVPTVFFTDNDFASVLQIPLTEALPPGSSTAYKATIVNGQFRIALNAVSSSGTVMARYFVGSELFSGIVPYADFTGMSITEALVELAVILNGVYGIDRDGKARFVLRDLDSGEASVSLDDLIIERSDLPVWQETFDYVEVSAEGGVKGAAGTKTAVSRNLSVSVRLPVSGGVATSIAEYLFRFYSVKRQLVRASFDDADDYPLQLMDPVTLDGNSWLLYQVDRDCGQHQAQAVLLEKAS